MTSSGPPWVYLNPSRTDPGHRMDYQVQAIFVSDFAMSKMTSDKNTTNKVESLIGLLTLGVSLSVPNARRMHVDRENVLALIAQPWVTVLQNTSNANGEAVGHTAWRKIANKSLSTLTMVHLPTPRLISYSMRSLGRTITMRPNLRTTCWEASSARMESRA